MWVCIGVIYIIYKFCKESDVKGFVNSIGKLPETPETLYNKLHTCGFKVDREVVERLFSHPNNPLNSGHFYTVSTGQMYTWMCDEESWQIGRLSDERLEELLGIPIRELPIDPSLDRGGGILKRQVYARHYLLRQKGLEYRQHMNMIYLNEQYYKDFDLFIQNYNSEHHRRDTS